jgi:hypothetical protein
VSLILGAVDPTFALANRIEAALWFLIALILLITHLFVVARYDALIAAGAFALFGVSDLIEAHTGAWWHPWWLLVWKACCLVVFACLLVRHNRRKRSS